MNISKIKGINGIWTHGFYKQVTAEYYFNDLHIAITTDIVQNHSSQQLLRPIHLELSAVGISKYFSNYIYKRHFAKDDSIRRNVFILEIKDLSSKIRICVSKKYVFSLQNSLLQIGWLMEKKSGLEVKRPGSISKTAFTQRTCICLGKDLTCSNLILSKCRCLTNLTLIYQNKNAIQIKTQLHIMLRK